MVLKKKRVIFLKCIISLILGTVLNIALSSKNKLIVKSLGNIDYNIPFVLTLSINQIVNILILTSTITFFIYFYFDHSKESKSEISIIFEKLLEVEFVIFSFIIGTQFFSLNGNFNIEYFKILYKDLNLFILLCKLGIFICTSIVICRKEKAYLKKIKEVYKSREVFLNTIDEYLRNMKCFSIVGDWGIGKTVLIENFFYGSYISKKTNKYYKENYKLLYIDISIYSDNQKIIEKIENELDVIFNENRILKNRKSFRDELFLKNNNFLKEIYLYLFSRDSLNEIRDKIKRKINEMEKSMVICLDNMERLNSKDRILNLFAIINEIIPENIKKIYVYDEKEMEKIFSINKKCYEKNECNFIEYISKYTFNKIEIKDIKIEEVYNDKKYLLDNLLGELENNDFEVKIKYNLLQYFENNEYYTIFEDNIKLKKDLIKKQLKNPRYGENVLEYIGENTDDIEKIKYKFEYKLMRDFFPTLDLELIKNRYFFKSKLANKVKISNEKLSSSEIEEILMLYLFKLDKDGYPKHDIEIKNTYYESFYLNVDIKDSSNYQRLETLKKNPKKNLLEVIIWENLLNNNNVKKIRNFLETNKKIKYIISSSEDLNKLMDLINLEEYYDLLFPMIILNKHGKYINGYSEEITLKEYQDILKKSYLLKNINIQNLFQISNSEENIQSYLNFVPDTITDEQFNEFRINLKKSIDKETNILIELNLYDKTKKSLDILDSFMKLKIEKFFLKDSLKEIDESIFKKNKKDLLNMIDFDKDKFTIKEINILINDIDFFINQVKLKKKDNEFEEGANTILIEMYKFKNQKK